MDFMIQPLPLEDDVHTVSRIAHLWGLPTADEAQVADMDSELLAWTGSAASLDDFLVGFVLVGDGDAHWDVEHLSPLAEYIRSLRPPTPLTRAPEVELARGEQVFAQSGCLDCHDGPRGSGRRVFSFEEIGTDPALQAWADPDLDGWAPDGTRLTHGIKSPRLVGLHTFDRFLHNGSVRSLEELLCVGGERPPAAPAPFGNQGHLFGCGLAPADKTALIAYLQAQ